MQDGDKNGTPSPGISRSLLILAVLYVLLTWPVVLSGLVGPEGPANDEVAYHRPTVEQFARQFPLIDISDYPSALAPGYYLFLCSLVKGFGAEIHFLRLVSGLFVLGSILLACHFAARHANSRMAFFLVLPLLALPISLRSGMWLLADFPAFFFVVLALGMVAMERPGPGHFLIAVLAAALAVLFRQIHLWVVGIVVLSILARTPLRALLPRAIRPSAAGTSWLYLPVAVLAAAIPLMLLLGLYRVWGGLTPPSYQGRHAGINPATLSVALALLGLWGPFFVTLPGGIGVHFKRKPFTFVLAALAGILLTLLCPTSYSMEEGRWGGPIWTAASVLPVIAERSILFPPLAGLGAALVWFLWSRAAERGRPWQAGLLVISLIAVAVAHAGSRLAFQRYLDPPILLLLGWLTCLGLRTGRQEGMSTWPLGPLVLAGLLFALSLLTEYYTIFRIHPLG
jgi:hypothetical protein